MTGPNDSKNQCLRPLLSMKAGAHLSASFGSGSISHSCRILATILTSALGACASYPSHIAAGMTHSQLLEQFGTPSVERATASGALMIYSTAPMGQYAYAAILDRAEQVVEVDQVLTPANFSRIEKGAWDREEVLSHFGLPAARRTIRGSEVWDYRYKEFNVYNSLYTITFDPAGLVAKTENGPDLLGDNGREGHHR